MNPEKYLDSYQDREEPRVEDALRNFRSSVHLWSEQEFVRPRVIERSNWTTFRDGLWRVIANPALGGTLAAALLVTSIGIPVGVHHQREVAAEHQAALKLQQQQAAEQAKKAAAAVVASAAVDDTAFLDDVDSDIAQDAPNAMQPLASLMNDGPGKSSRR